MEEIKQAFNMLVLEVLKFLGLVASILVVNFLTILRNNVKNNIIKRKVLDWAVSKAIKMEGDEFAKFTNTEKWARLVENAAKVGITEDMLKQFESDIIGAVEEWKNCKKSNNIL